MSYLMIDLSQEIYEGMPLFPIHQKTFIMKNFTHEENMRASGSETLGFSARSLIISEHAGTHSDGIWEYKPSGRTIDEMDLKFFIGRGICLDVSDVRYPSYIEVEDLKNALIRSSLSIEEDTIVLLYTGHWNRTYGSKAYTESYTGLTYEAAEWLIKQGAINIGIDAPAIDQTPDDLYFSGHKACGDYDITNTENLINLDKISGLEFFYIGLPLKIRKGSGSPIRAIALVEQ